MRAAAAARTSLFTGDDFHYVELIEGDGERHSDALLGVVRARRAARLAPRSRPSTPATPPRTGAILGPTEPLARHVFAAPTFHYKTGVAFLSWLNGHQHGVHHGRRPARGAQPAAPVRRWCGWPTRPGALEDPDLAARRWNALLALHGVDVPTAVLT